MLVVTAGAFLCGLYIFIRHELHTILAEVVESRFEVAVMALVALGIGCWIAAARIRGDAAFVIAILLGFVFLGLALTIPTLH